MDVKSLFPLLYTSSIIMLVHTYTERMRWVDSHRRVFNGKLSTKSMYLYILLGYKEEMKESIENGTKNKWYNNHSLKNIKRTNFEI